MVSTARPRWLVSQIALSTASCCLASLWMVQVAPAAVLYLAVAVGTAIAAIAWLRGWSQLRRGGAIIGGALLAVLVPVGPAIVLLMTYLAAATATSLTLRTREPMAPVLPTLTLMLVGVTVSPWASAWWFVSSTPYGFNMLLTGLVRERARAPELPLDARTTASVGSVRRRRPYMSVPRIGVLTLTALLLTAVLPATDEERWHASSLAGGLTARQPATSFDSLNRVRHLEPTRTAAWDGAGPRLQAVADALHAGPTSEALRRLADHLRSQVDDVADGTSGRITVATLDEVLASGRGSPEQKAGVLANAAAAAGYRARIVRGRVSITRTGPGGERLVADAADGTATAYPHVWAEVHCVGYGWVSFETTDLTVVRALDQDRAALTSIDWWHEGAGGRLLAIGRAVVRSELLVALPFVVLAAAPGLIIASVVVMAALRLARRAVRRRRGAVDSRIAGAWHELADLLRLRGIDASAAQTGGDVAAVVRDALGDTIGDLVAALAVLADAAWFGAQPPEADDARIAWRLESVAREQLLRTVPAWRRWILVADPRPVWQR